MGNHRLAPAFVVSLPGPAVARGQLPAGRGARLQATPHRWRSGSASPDVWRCRQESADRLGAPPLAAWRNGVSVIPTTCRTRSGAGSFENTIAARHATRDYQVEVKPAGAAATSCCAHRRSAATAMTDPPGTSADRPRPRRRSQRSPTARRGSPCSLLRRP